MTTPPTIAVRGEEGANLSVAPPDPLRYESHPREPWESAGMLLELVPPGGRVLDVGCGTGSLSALLRDERQCHVTGIEPSPDRAAKASERGFTVHVGAFPHPDLSATPQFDAVLFADVLEHLPDPGIALQAAQEHLQPDGVLLISIPNVAHWSIRWRLFWGRWDYEPSWLMDATHLRWFTRSSLTRLLESNGWQVETCAASAGTDLPVYMQSWPWRWLGRRTRDRIIRRGVRHWPTLFGCQWIVRARRRHS